jgi:hypothetical protein
MDELHDVSAQTPSNNDGLFYNSTNSLWENKPIATALGYTPANAATTLTINGVTYDLSTSRSWTVSGGISGSGASGQVAYWTGASAQSGSNNLFWDATNSNLGIGSNNVNALWKLGVSGNIQIGGYLSFGVLNANNSTAYIEVTASAMNIYAHTSRVLTFSANASERARIFTTGNLAIGSTTDSGERLQVTGDVKVVGSGNTSATNALMVRNSSNTALLQVRNNGNVVIGAGNQGIDTTLLNISGSFAYLICTPASGYSAVFGTYSSFAASAVVQCDSTTRGFLPPRMTTTQKNAISSPAAGLVVYDTTLNKLCVYTTAWETITSI